MLLMDAGYIAGIFHFLLNLPLEANEFRNQSAGFSSVANSKLTIADSIANSLSCNDAREVWNPVNNSRQPVAVSSSWGFFAKVHVT